MSAFNDYVSNTSVKDLNLDLTLDDLSNLDKFDDSSKRILNLEALTSESKFGKIPDLTTDSTTINMSAAFVAARQYVERTDQFARSGISTEPFKTPLSEVRRYDDSGFEPGKRIGPNFQYDRNNEDWMAQNESVWANLGKGLLRLPLSTGFKIGQNTGFLLGLIDPTNWGDNYIQNASQNAMAQVFGHLDEQLKNDWLPVYEKAEAQGAGFWWRATHDLNFWTNDFTDGVAFMVSAFAPGMAFSRLGVGEKIARGLSGYKLGAGAANNAIEGAASVQNYLTKAQSIWANRLDRVSQWALSVGGESMFETTEVGKNIEKGLTTDERGFLRINPNTGLPYTKEEKKLIAASHMKETFMANAAILSATNLWELKLLNSMWGKAATKPISKGLMGGTRLGDELAYELSNTGIGKLLNSKPGIFLTALGKGTLMEGFVEENAQLAIQRVNEKFGVEGKMAELKDVKSLANQYWNQTLNAVTGKDPEASISIGLGGILGGGMSVYSELKQAKRNDEFTKAAVKFYNEAQQNWLKFGNIFETKMVTTKDKDGNEVSEEQIILDEKGKPTINQSKLFNVANNFNNVNSAIEAANTVENKFHRDLLRDSAFAQFVNAHIQLGLENTLLGKLDAVGRTDAGELAKLGFTPDETTPQQIEKYKNLTKQMIAQNKILNDDIIFKKDWRGRMLPEEEARKNKMTELATRLAIYRNLVNETTADNNEFKNEMLNQIAKEDIGLSDDLADQLNDLQLRIDSQKDYIEGMEISDKKPIEKALAKTVLNELQKELDTLKKDNPEALKTIKKGPDGLYQYEKANRNQVQNVILRNKLYSRQQRSSQLQNQIRQLGLEWAKYADTKNGAANFKEYIDNVIVKPFNEIADRAERGKSQRFTDEERKKRREERKGKKYEEGTSWVKKGTNATFLYRMKDDDRIAEDIMEYYDVQDGETVALKPMIQKMAANPYIDPYLRMALARLYDSIKDDAKVKFDRNQTIAPAFYTLGSNTITIDPDLHEGKMSFEGVMLHEIIHLLTSDELAYNSKFTRDIEKLYNYAKKTLEDRGIDTSYYGFTNIQEFLAEAYSNPEFQKELTSVPGLTGKKSLWVEFVDALSDFFKRVFNLELKPSVLDDIFYKVDEYLSDNIYTSAARLLKENGLTEEEIENYSKREIIDMAINEKLITDDLVVMRAKFLEEIEQEKKKEEEEKRRKELESQQQQGQQGQQQQQTETSGIDFTENYIFNGKKYDIAPLGDLILLNALDGTDDNIGFTEEEFLDNLKTGKLKRAKDVEGQEIPNTVEEYLQQQYNKVKASNDAADRETPPYEIWEKTSGKFERQRYERLKGGPKPKTEEYKIDDNVVFEDKEYTVAEITKTQDGRVVYHLKDLEGNPLVASDGVKRFVEASSLKKAEPKPDVEINYFDQIQVNNEFTDDQGNIYKIASVIPGKAVNYIVTNNAGETSFDKALIDDFLGKLENGTYKIRYSEFIEDDPSAVRDFVQNNRFDTTGLQSSRSDNNTANVTYQEGRRQTAPSNSLANTTDIAEFRVTGDVVTQVRTGVNTNYVFDIATGNFPEGSSLTYRVMTKDFPTVTNRITGDVYDAGNIFGPDGKVNPEMYDYAPIGVYATIEGKEKLIGTFHEPQWINHKIFNKYVNIVVPEDQLDMDLPTVVKEEVAKNQKFRKFILDNFNNDPSFEMNGIVEGKSIGILRNTTDPGVIKDRVNPKIADGGTDNRHGMFAIVKNGELQVDAGVVIDKVENTKSFTEEIDNQSGVSVLLLPTPRGTFFPTYVKLPKVSENKAKLIIEAWKAFVGETMNPKLVEGIYKALGMEMSEGKPDIGVLQRYVDQFITRLKKEQLSEIGNGSDVANGLARLNITAQGHLYLQVKTADGEWFNNDGKPIVLSSELPGNVISLMQNLLTTVKFTDPRNPNLVGINNTKKVPFVTIQNNEVKITPMTYNEYIMQNAMTYVEEGIPSKNKDGDWVYFANPVIKMSSNTDAIVVKPKEEEVVVGDTFEKPPVVTPAPTAPVSDIEKRRKEIEDFRTDAKEDIVVSVLGTKGQRWGTVIRVHKKENTNTFKQYKLTDFETKELLEKEIDKIYDAELAALTQPIAPVVSDKKAIVAAGIREQGTQVSVEVIGDSGKEFLLVIDRNSKGRVELFSEKKDWGDGTFTYRPGESEQASQEQKVKLYNKYVPESVRNLITEWQNSFTGSWAAPETEDGKRHRAIEAKLEKELAALEGAKPATASVSNVKANIEERRKAALKKYDDEGGMYDDDYGKQKRRINAQYDAELARELYKELKAGKIITSFSKEEQEILNDSTILTSEIKASVDAELAAAEVKPTVKQTKKSAKTQLRFAKVGDVLYDEKGNKYEVISKKDKYGRSLEYKKNDVEQGVINPKTVGPYDNPFAMEDLYYEKPEVSSEQAAVNPDDIFAQLDRIAIANQMTDEQVEKEKDKCNTKPKSKK
jgi:hypothetical protein